MGDSNENKEEMSKLAETDRDEIIEEKNKLAKDEGNKLDSEDEATETIKTEESKPVEEDEATKKKKEIITKVSSKFTEMLAGKTKENIGELKMNSFTHEEIEKCYSDQKVINLSIIPELPGEFVGEIVLLRHLLTSKKLNWEEFVTMLGRQYTFNFDKELNADQLEGLLFNPKVLLLRYKYELANKKYFEDNLNKFVKLDEPFENVKYEK